MNRFLKYAATSLIAMLLMAGSVFAETEVAEKPGLLRRLFANLTWQETLLVTETPRDAVAAVTRRIKHRTEIGDALVPAETAWKRGFGDCEDIAHAIVAICRKQGFEAWVEVFYSSESFVAHAVAMGRIDGQLWVAERTLIKVDDIESARKRVATTMRWKPTNTSSKPWKDFEIFYNVAKAN